MKAIETQYKGYRFRSRTEARWAVAFDNHDIEWDYEPEGIKTPIGWYLPDFYLPQVDMYAEVKGKQFTENEILKCHYLSEQSERPVLMLDGQPENTNYWATHNYEYETTKVNNMIISVIDFCPFNSKKYHISEKRFFSATGESYPDKDKSECYNRGNKAINAARSARFEHGESPV